MKKILFLAANPQGTTKLALEKEVDEIEEGLKQSDIQIQIVKLSEVRTQDLRRALIREKPDILHFSGHGEGQAGLILTDDAGQLKRVSSSALAELFDFFAEQVKCVVLNACYSKDQAEAIVQHIDYVIGMRQEVKDHVAIQFSIGFYDALGSGLSIEKAFKMGCNAIHLESSNSDARSQAERTLIPTRKAVQKTVLDHLIPDLLKKLDYITSASDLSSACGANYKTLQSLLAMRKWKEADEETYRLILAMSYNLRLEEVPHTDLRTIDTLWSKSSNGKFGLTAQLTIWSRIRNSFNENKLWHEFCNRIGWCSQNQKLLGLPVFGQQTEKTIAALRECVGQPDQILSSLPSGYFPTLVKSISDRYKVDSFEKKRQINSFFSRVQENSRNN